MKIAFILPGRNLSGGVRVTVVVANWLLKRGHDVRLFYQTTSIRGVVSRILKGKWERRKDWLDDFRGESVAFRRIRDCRFHTEEILVGVGMWSSLQLGMLGHLRNPKLQYIHGATPWDPDLQRKALELLLPKIAVGQYLRSVIAEHGGDLIAIIPNGVDTEEYYPVHGPHPRDGIGTIFSSHPAKAPRNILRLLERFSKEMPEIPIRMFGAEPPPSNLPTSIHYFQSPSVEKAREIYSQSLVWLLASESEGFPAPILEAMACGCVVISTDCGGPRDILEPGENGFLVHPGDMEGMFDRTVEILRDDEALPRMSMKAMQSVQRFRWEDTILLLEQCLAKVSKSI